MHLLSFSSHLLHVSLDILYSISFTLSDFIWVFSSCSFTVFFNFHHVLPHLFSFTFYLFAIFIPLSLSLLYYFHLCLFLSLSPSHSIPLSIFQWVSVSFTLCNFNFFLPLYLSSFVSFFLNCMLFLYIILYKIYASHLSVLLSFHRTNNLLFSFIHTFPLCYIQLCLITS